jgi:hypothetical protein
MWREFCDIPFDLFDVHVGGHLCGSVVVRALLQTWPNGLDVPVFYRNCHTSVLPLPCTVVLRFQQAEDPSPLVGVRVALPGIGVDTTSDKFGRVFVLLSRGSSAMGVASRIDLRTSNLALECLSPDWAEEVVKMSRR